MYMYTDIRAGRFFFHVIVSLCLSASRGIINVVPAATPLADESALLLY
jgi:hypothetical protein